MKPLDFVTPAAKKDYLEFPDDIQDIFGFALFQVQEGKRPSIAKNIGSAMEELREDDDQNKTYRVVYVAHFEECVYVLHAFTKKSTEGIKTPDRFNEAKKKHEKYLKEQEKK